MIKNWHWLFFLPLLFWFVSPCSGQLFYTVPDLITGPIQPGAIGKYNIGTGRFKNIINEDSSVAASGITFGNGTNIYFCTENLDTALNDAFSSSTVYVNFFSAPLSTLVPTQVCTLSFQWNAFSYYPLYVAAKGNYLFFTTPALVDGTSATISKLDLATMQASVVVENLSKPSGLTFDTAGDLYFCDSSFPGGAQISLNQYKDSVLTNLVELISASENLDWDAAWNPCLAAAPDGNLLYTLPTQYSSLDQTQEPPVSGGAIMKLDLATLQSSLVQSAVDPLGLAIDIDGNIFFGDCSSDDDFEMVSLYELDTDGELSNLGLIRDGHTGFTDFPLYNFSIGIPRPIIGVDVSHFNNEATPVDMMNFSTAVKAGRSFVFVKLTQGTMFTDPEGADNIEEAHAAGMLVAPYHLAGRTIGDQIVLQDPIAEARYFLNQGSAYIRNEYLPPILDVEAKFDGNEATYAKLTGMTLDRWVLAWLQFVQQQTGVAPIVYANYSVLPLLPSITNAYPLWIAAEDNDPTAAPTFGAMSWTQWLFKQYASDLSSDPGHCPGIPDTLNKQGVSAVDLDSFNGDLTTLMSMTNYPPFVKFSGLNWTPLTPPTNGSFQFQFFSATLKSVSVFASTDLIHWDNIGKANMTANRVGIFLDVDAGSHQSRYYRIESQ